MSERPSMTKGERIAYEAGKRKGAAEVRARVAALPAAWEALASRPNGAYEACARELRAALNPYGGE